MKKIIASVLMTATLVFALAPTALAADKRIKVSNRSGINVIRFYGSRSDINSWEEDLLGRDILPMNYSVIIDFEDGTDKCLYDMKAVFSDGREVYKYNVNVCTEYLLIIK